MGISLRKPSFACTESAKKDCPRLRELAPTVRGGTTQPVGQTFWPILCVFTVYLELDLLLELAWCDVGHGNFLLMSARVADRNSNT